VDDKAFIASVSPITYVDKNSPPTFIVHGDADPTVPYQESIALHQKFVDAGVKTQLMIVEGGLHGKFPPEKKSEVSKAIMDFLKELKIY